MKEVWKIIEKRTSIIEVSNFGNVRGFIKNEPIKVEIVKNRRCISSKYKIFKLVWEAFNGKTPRGYCIHHIDCNKLNDRLDNLQLMKNSEHTALHNKLNPRASGLKWYNNGFKNTRAKECPKGYVEGRIFLKPFNRTCKSLSDEHKQKISKSLKNRKPWNKNKHTGHWYNNGIKETYAITCPAGFSLGRIKKHSRQ